MSVDGEQEVRIDLLGLLEAELRSVEEVLRPRIERLCALRELRDRAFELVDRHRDGLVSVNDLRADALSRGGEVELQRILGLLDRASDDADDMHTRQPTTNGVLL